MKEEKQTIENGQICDEGQETEHKTKVCYCAGGRAGRAGSC